jgi:hypothetical protein
MCVPYPVIVCGEALVRVWLQEMLLRHTTLHICMYIPSIGTFIKRERERERERENKN